LPQEWTDDRARCAKAGIPEEVTFATKPELARRMVERAFDAGARPAWVVADAVYGADSKLRFFLEERQQPYVLAVASNQCVWVGLTQSRVNALAAQLPAGAWRRLTVGAEAKGPRRFEWAAVPINHPYDPRHWQRWLLVRRSCDDPQDLAFSSETTQGSCLGGFGKLHQIEAKPVGAFAQRAHDLVFVF
jgi:SRSO17 transposase